MTVQGGDSGGSDSLEELRGELAAARRRISELEAALQSSRVTGSAVGVLVERYHITPDVAWQVLTEVGEETEQAVPDVAAYLLSTGALPVAWPI